MWALSVGREEGENQEEEEGGEGKIAEDVNGRERRGKKEGRVSERNERWEGGFVGPGKGEEKKGKRTIDMEKKGRGRRLREKGGIVE